MEIRNILSSVYKNDEQFKSVASKKAETQKKDKIEISDEAKALNNTDEKKDLSEIQKKIESGFYNTNKVISKVADAILKEIGK